MAYDPTLPANNSLISSSELRNQFSGLKSLIDGCATPQNIEDSIMGETPAPIPEVGGLGMFVSDPPTQAEVQTIADKLDELIGALKR